MKPEKGQSEQGDPQDKRPKVSMPLAKAGILNYKLPLKLSWGSIFQETSATVSAFVDVPAERRGAHFSKILKPVIVGLGGPGDDITERVHETAKKILLENSYSGKATLTVRTTYLMPHEDAPGVVSHIPYNFEFSTEIYSNGDYTDSFTLETTAMTACPCTMEGTRKLLSNLHPEASSFISRIPTVTHSQRNRLRISIHSNEKCTVDPLAFIRTVEAVTGGPLLSIFPNDDSDRFVLNVHLNPFFVEDLIRELAYAISAEFLEIPGNAMVSISSRSEESLHNHDAWAELELRMDEIKRKSWKK
jgi:GTP cyclohydrolase-4